MWSLYIVDIACFLLAIFFSILFLHSGFDKVFNRDDNISYFRSHFQATYFSNFIILLFWMITSLECFTGIVCLSSILLLLSPTTISLAYHLLAFGFIFSNITIICLFLGQRIAKDYAGAASLAVYFVNSIVGLLLLNFI